jgi:predicted nucleotidyltransferase
VHPEPATTTELVRRIRDACAPTRIILFGSAARGEMRSGSDLDVLVVVSRDQDRRQVTRAIYRRLIGFGVSTDVIVATEEDLARYGDNRSLVYYPALREGQ